MKRITTALFCMLLSLAAFSQYAGGIKLDHGQDNSIRHVLVSQIIGEALPGRGDYAPIYDFADMLSPFLQLSSLDTALIVGNSLALVFFSGDTTWFEGGGDQLWTLGGTLLSPKIYPTSLRPVYIGASNFTGTGALNVMGSIDVRDNTGSLYIGVEAGLGSTGQNLAVGHLAGSAASGDFNTMVGLNAGSGNHGQFGSFFGTNAGFGNTGDGNTFIGMDSAPNSNEGDWNTFLGLNSGYLNMTGSRNTYIGFSSGHNSNGSGNIFLGHSSGANASVSDELWIDATDTLDPLIWGSFLLNMVHVNGDLSANNLSGTNTGDQDLSGYSLLGHTHSFASLTGKPTTIAGYGITDFNSLGDARWLQIANNLSDLNNAATARTNLGATTLGGNFYTLANPSAIRYVRINADNTITLRTAAEMLSDLGGGGSDGNGLYDVANENGTAAVSFINIDDDGLFFQDADGTGFFGYDPGNLGFHIIDYDVRPAMWLQNLSGTYGTYIQFISGNVYDVGVHLNGDFEIIDGSIKPFTIEETATVDHALRILATGKLRFAGHSSADDDGTPTAIFYPKDVNGNVGVAPLADIQLTQEQIEDYAGDMVSGNTETNITVTYDDPTGKLNFSVPTTTLAKYNVGCTVDGAGDVITTGVKGFTSIPASGTITAVTLVADLSGDATFTIRKSTFAGFPGSLASIVGANTPNLTGAQSAQITLDGAWTLSVTAGDIIEWGITGSPATITRVHIFVTIQP